MRAIWGRAADRLYFLINDSLLSLVARLAIAGVFLMSGRTKVEGFLTITDSTYELFRTEYKLPLVPRKSPRTWRPMPSTCFRCC